MRERGSIIDSIAHIRDALALGLPGLHDFKLCARKYVRLDLFDSQLACDRLRGLTIIPRDHHDLFAHANEFRDSRLSRRLGRIRNGDETGEFIVDTHHNHRLSLTLPTIHRCSILSDITLLGSADITSTRSDQFCPIGHN
ncbi:MAG: hypothetical protein UY76_C0034G0007 [Candidatus Uhrbacteria bacterium GW2011_GWA2_52_8d]|uniref:Uncharacterized protein n=1 Tax=Candidatus Uhrbacteria bacterium GW2011_GWA2_52_8d TaxID=1618979 RepID=A0A0G1XN21_9BACT|nr:MAG: hypothetical protein UY76_C0034G0007 [Candidatus Uhrbacteria bacterium GW2011_GWA2_52_8d]